MTETETKPKPLSPEEATELQYLKPETLEFARNGVDLRLTVKDDRSYLKVSLVRIFPLSEPKKYISIRYGANKEAGILVDPAALAPEYQSLVADSLHGRYMVASIRRVLRVKERFGTLDWEVETDRGPHSFTTRNLRENSSKPSPGRYIISDVDGNRYDLPNLAALDAASQTMILRFL